MSSSGSSISGKGGSGIWVWIFLGATLGLSRSLFLPLVDDGVCVGVDFDDVGATTFELLILNEEVGVVSLGTAVFADKGIAGNA